MPVGVVTFHRQVLTTPPRWEKSSSLFTNLHMDSEGNIEDHGRGMLQVYLIKRKCLAILLQNFYLPGVLGLCGRGCPLPYKA